jgi:hypothetical protein
MDEVVLRYHELTKGVKPRHLRSPCEIGDHIFWPFGYLGRRIKFMLTGRPPRPTDRPSRCRLEGSHCILYPATGRSRLVSSLSFWIVKHHGTIFYEYIYEALFAK